MCSAFNVDVVEIIEGTGPKLRSYCVTRKGEGQLVDKAHGMEYFNLGASFQNRIAEPLYVNCSYRPDATDIELTSHEGQECDIVLQRRAESAGRQPYRTAARRRRDLL